MSNDHSKDVLLSLLQNYYSRLEHYETQWSTVSNLLVIVAAAILAFVTFDQKLTLADLPLTLLLSFMGIFGAGFCAKIHERSARIYVRVQGLRKALDETLFNSPVIEKIRDEADQRHAKTFPRFQDSGSLSWVKVHGLWITFHVFIALLGFILTALIYFV
jgi:hypothetical protein